MDLGADIDDARLVEIAQAFLADIGNIAGDRLRPELGVACHVLEFLDVDRGEHVIAHDALGNEDGVLEIIAVPGHERDQNIAAKREFTEIGRRSVGHDITGLDPVAHLHHRTLVDTGVLVRALELAQIVDIDHRIGALVLAGHPDDDAGRVDLVDHAAAARNHRGPGITSAPIRWSISTICARCARK